MSAPADVGVPWRVPLLLLAFASLGLGTAAGLARLGWSLPVRALPALHGPLMASGFLGTVIGLERAVALRRRWAYLAPLLSGLATVAALLAVPASLPPALATAGSLVMLAASVVVYRRQRASFTLTLALGAACWAAGSVLWWRGWPFDAVAPWWVAFLVLTIAGERLELSRLLPPSAGARRAFAVLTALLLAGVTASLVARRAGTVACGVALAGLAAWLFRQDVARRTVRGSGLTRYIAVCLLSGYAWLAVSGVLVLLHGGLGTAGPAYDAALHALLLGFVFAMVFGHAPVIFPAVLGLAVPYYPYFYVPLALLHASLAVRLAGDLLGLAAWRAAGGALNGVALLVFVAGTAGAVAAGARAAGKGTRGA